MAQVDQNTPTIREHGLVLNSREGRADLSVAQRPVAHTRDRIDTAQAVAVNVLGIELGGKKARFLAMNRDGPECEEGAEEKPPDRAAGSGLPEDFRD